MRTLAPVAFIASLLMVGGSASVAQVIIPKSAKAISDKYYKVGGKVKPPKPADTPEPSASKAEVNKSKTVKKVGATLLWIGIGSDGSVEAAFVVNSAGPELDNKAVEAVRQWKFQPATREGVPIPVQVNVEVNFHVY